MYHKTLTLIALLTATLTFSLAAEPTAKPFIFFVQQDMRPGVDDYGFEKGFAGLVKNLPADRDVVFVSFVNTDYKEEYAGKAGKLDGIPESFKFRATSTATNPYKTLAKYLKDKGIRETTVYVIGNGVSQDLLQMSDTGSPMDNFAFVPDRYPPLPELVDFCKKNEIRLVGFFVQKRPAGVRTPSFTLFRDAFLYLMDNTKGEGYWNFTSFEGIFQAAQKKYFR